MIVEKKNCYLTVDVTVLTVRPIDHSIAIWTAYALKPEVLNDKKKCEGTVLRYLSVLCWKSCSGFSPQRYNEK